MHKYYRQIHAKVSNNDCCKLGGNLLGLYLPAGRVVIDVDWERLLQPYLFWIAVETL